MTCLSFAQMVDSLHSTVLHFHSETIPRWSRLRSRSRSMQPSSWSGLGDVILGTCYGFTSREVNEAKSLIPATGRVRSKSKKRKTKHETPPHPKHTTKSTAARRPRPPPKTACDESRPRVSPYSLSSIDSGCVEIGLVQLSQSVKNTNVTQTHRHTNKTMAPCTNPGMKRLFCPIGKNGLNTSREVNEARRPHAFSRPCAFEKKNTHEKPRPTQNTPRKPQQPGDRGQFETARDETRPTR